MAIINNIEAITLSSLAKVFPERICGPASERSEVASGQQISFQIAYRRIAPRYDVKDYNVKLTSSLAEYISLYSVGLVPSELPVYPERTDENYLTYEPGLFPDPLFPIEDGTFRVPVAKWRAMWVSIDIPADMPAGEYPVSIEISLGTPEDTATVTYTVSVHSVALPKQEMLFTQWFHCDCIADAHGVPVFTEEHWSLIEKYMSLAAKHGMNMILTPVLTPALDTAVGAERPTVQLVGVTLENGTYAFDFTLLERFVELAHSVGIDNFEISHFFTQWGAEFCPKVMATVDGEYKRIFGWDTAADCDGYKAFLSALIPELIAKFESLGVRRDQLWFHVSDEPHEAHLAQYRICESMIHDLIKGCHHMDALSDYNFYGEGLVETPVVATNKIDTFIEKNVQNLWGYYCCGQCIGTSNRFFAMPSARNRMIGVQLYKYNIKGFLHWGYNFYYTQYSKRKIDPFRVTDSDVAFPSGDAFSVYPYGNGVIPSLRQKVFLNALEDMRLLTLCEQKIGREAVISALDSITPITFTTHAPEDFFERMYEFIFETLS